MSRLGDEASEGVGLERGVCPASPGGRRALQHRDVAEVDVDGRRTCAPLHGARHDAPVDEGRDDIDLQGRAVTIATFPAAPALDERVVASPPQALVRLRGDAFELEPDVGAEVRRDGLAVNVERVGALEQGEIGLDETLVEPNGGIGDRIRDRLVRMRVDVRSYREVAEVDETRELVTKAGVVGEAGALRDRVAPGLASRDGAQDGAILRDVSKAYFLLDGRLYELPNFAPGRER